MHGRYDTEAVSWHDLARTSAAAGGTSSALPGHMGMLVVVVLLIAMGSVLALFVHALRAERSVRAHGWLVVVPLLIVAGWLLETLVMS